MDDGVFSWEEEEAAEAFWLDIGLGLAATVLMTISIWYEGTLAEHHGGAQEKLCSSEHLFVWTLQGLQNMWFLLVEEFPEH